jgi:hypothetical protein
MNPLFRESLPASGPGGPPAKATHRVDYRHLVGAAREAMRSGRIPSRAADQMWGGSGSGAICAICTRPLAPHEVEYELQFAHGADARSYHVHVPCCMAWEVELS